MKLELQSAIPSKHTSFSLVIGIYEDGKLTKNAALIDKETGGFITRLLKQGAFEGKLCQLFSLFEPGNSTFQHVVLVGLGKENKLSPVVLHKVTTAATKFLIQAKTKKAVFYLTDVAIENKDAAWIIKHLAEAIGDGFYRFDMFKSEKEPAATLNEIILNCNDIKHEKTCKQALHEGDTIANAKAFTKNLANLPSNICTPTFLGDQAKELEKEYKSIKVNILNEKEMQKLGMGALLAVSQGSAEEAKLICLEYRGGNKHDAPIALVGKGITFDTGGNSLKPADSMVGMKYDMCGAATVLGVLKAVAMLKLKINVVGIVPAVENMPGGTAYKPEDILTSMSKQTIEVISTDAEGRLILADALTYTERYKPAAVIDIATLTGAVVIGLGFHATGLCANNDELAKELLKASEESCDRAWQLPMWDEYQEQIKSPFADMANTGGRAAGTITAACFLSRFAKKFKWAHLDVAGTAAMMAGTADRMATGRPVPMLVQYLIDRAN